MNNDLTEIFKDRFLQEVNKVTALDLEVRELRRQIAELQQIIAQTPDNLPVIAEEHSDAT